MAIVPSYISRSVAGSYDNEGVAIFALVITFYLWVKAVNTGRLAWAAGCALGYFYMVAAWGGYVFIINIIPIYVLLMVVIGRYSPRLYVLGCAGWHKCLRSCPLCHRVCHLLARCALRLRHVVVIALAWQVCSLLHILCARQFACHASSVCSIQHHRPGGNCGIPWSVCALTRCASVSRLSHRVASSHHVLHSVRLRHLGQSSRVVDNLEVPGVRCTGIRGDSRGSSTDSDAANWSHALDGS